jgi:hypothetical protein
LGLHIPPGGDQRGGDAFRADVPFGELGHGQWVQFQREYKAREETAEGNFTNSRRITTLLSAGYGDVFTLGLWEEMSRNAIYEDSVDDPEDDKERE